ncbi:hypothetical protein PLICRDRAFT_180014 [Plicaturopsis crispa FD-325 SS-3]|uniref:DUF6534 domain-containing protein n=1 Tax=Plicaturopsis crispa FD-325 SS-3 TaxID=944288 RepID=A0A0C9SQR1_PLICR|nr:hypothetical protein PLICRDRAFT_180014 [Plicaturopsis crispa FD-325 SS-3]
MSSTTIISAPTQEQLVSGLAPYLLGTSFNSILLGCLSVQLYIYSISSHGDRTGTKVLGEYSVPPSAVDCLRSILLIKLCQILAVYSVYILDLAQTAVTMYCAWLQLVWAQGPYESLSAFDSSLGVLQLLAGIVSCITQCFFARRIWILENTLVLRRLVTCIVMLAALQCASAVAYSSIIILDTITSTAARITVPTIWLTGSFICDALIAGSLLYIFFKARSETQIRRTTTLLTKLIKVTVETGFITAVVAGLQLIAYLLDIAVPNQYYVMFSLLLGKLYSNVLLATLNARTVTVRVDGNEVGTDVATKFSQGIVFRAAPPCSTQATTLSALVSSSEDAAASNGPVAPSKEHADGRLHV